MDLFLESAMNVLRKKGMSEGGATRDPRTGHASPAKALAEIALRLQSSLKCPTCTLTTISADNGGNLGAS
jgi:hypothetical protein